MAKRKSATAMFDIPCIEKTLPPEEMYFAALEAVEINPANAVPSGTLAKLGIELPVPAMATGAMADMDPEKWLIAVATQKYWGPAGVHQSVGFMGQISAALADKILASMNAWGAYCNVAFTIASGPVNRAQVRISFAATGYWSYMGTDVSRIPANQATMNLQGFNGVMRESEYNRVVTHEAGHTLGCPHEHMRPAIVAKLDPAKTIAYFKRTQGWDAQQVQQQVLTPLKESDLKGTATAEVDSIMCYGLPGEITIDGQRIPGGIDITANDGAKMGILYPKAIVVPPPVVPRGTIVQDRAGNTIVTLPAVIREV